MRSDCFDSGAVPTAKGTAINNERRPAFAEMKLIRFLIKFDGHVRIVCGALKVAAFAAHISHGRIGSLIHFQPDKWTPIVAGIGVVEGGESHPCQTPCPAGSRPWGDQG